MLAFAKTQGRKKENARCLAVPGAIDKGWSCFK